ncbi:protein arginine N-methyltransferase 7 isoform X1 [Microplitis demolitor]|uniref:protein arginine N-methyltransferase 7 isoform X1 n=1 Tax=Microplitis demolitor TaxID=69319 RepID=UPI0004CCFCB4|nr:protein arginine N-methyltransferase 7 isoform X1 [Microplitis demolitor]
MLSKVFLNYSRYIKLSKMSIFTQNYDPITGCSVWEEKNPDYDYHQEVARSAFADMLHDHERNEKYYLALQKAIAKKHKQGLKANVLDIGTGTGLLSMMAARCGADTIIACEAFRPMAECAEKIIKNNGFESRIKLIKKKSTEISVSETGDMKQRANILVTEVFDTELIGEGALPTFKHAHEHLLEKDCIVVPDSGTVWVQVVDSLTVRKWNRVNEIKDPKTGKLLMKPPNSVNECAGSSAVHDIQLSQLPRESFIPLLAPQPIFKFDWSGKIPLIFNEINTLQCNAIASGTAHAVFMWWDLNMDEDKEILLSCAPVWEHPDTKLDIYKGLSLEEMTDKLPWRDHWMQAIYYLPEEISIKINEQITLVGYHDGYSFWFNLPKSNYSKLKFTKSPVCDCSLHIAYSRTRLGQLNDSERNNKYINALKKHITSDTTCLCISDGSLIGIAAANLGAKKVILFEPNYLSRRSIECFIDANDLNNKIKIIESIEQFACNDNDDKSNYLIIGEPYYANSIFPWDNLRFWYLASTYANGIKSVPMSACIRGVIVEFKDLHHIRAPLGVCEGFDLTIFDKLIVSSSEISDHPVEVHPLWEYTGRALSAPFDIASFSFDQNFDSESRKEFSGQVPILEEGSCNGIALWVDWYLDSELMVSTGPSKPIIAGKKITWDMNNRQGVHLLRKIQSVTKQHSVTWFFKYHNQDYQYFDFRSCIKLQ